MCKAIETDRQTDRDSVGLHRVGPVPGRLHTSCQQLGDHRVSPAGPPPGLLACLCPGQLSLQDSVPCWKQLRTSGQSPKRSLSRPSGSTHPLDPIGSAACLFGFKSQLSHRDRSPRVYHVTLWPLDPSSQGSPIASGAEKPHAS